MGIIFYSHVSWLCNRDKYIDEVLCSVICECECDLMCAAKNVKFVSIRLCSFMLHASKLVFGRVSPWTPLRELTTLHRLPIVGRGKAHPTPVDAVGVLGAYGANLGAGASVVRPPINPWQRLCV